MTAQIRFRHTHGDVGPLTFDTNTPVTALKQRLLDEWPADGPLAAEKPASAAEVRLIGAGKFLDDAAALKDLPHVLGEPGAGIIVTLHVVLRKPQPQKPAAAKPQQPPGSKGCCVIS